MNKLSLIIFIYFIKIEVKIKNNFKVYNLIKI